MSTEGGDEPIEKSRIEDTAPCDAFTDQENNTKNYENNECQEESDALGNEDMDDQAFFASSQVWNCKNCIQMNQVEDDKCIECNTTKNSFGLRSCQPSRVAPLVRIRYIIERSPD
jgi:hypothetical protein